MPIMFVCPLLYMHFFFSLRLRIFFSKHFFHFFSLHLFFVFFSLVFVVLLSFMVFVVRAVLSVTAAVNIRVGQNHRKSVRFASHSIGIHRAWTSMFTYLLKYCVLDRLFFFVFFTSLFLHTWCILCALNCIALCNSKPFFSLSLCVFCQVCHSHIFVFKYIQFFFFHLLFSIVSFRLDFVSSILCLHVCKLSMATGTFYATNISTVKCIFIEMQAQFQGYTYQLFKPSTTFEHNFKLDAFFH